MEAIIKIKKDFIVCYMNEHGLSLNKLASNIGISPATLSRVLSGSRNPGQSVIAKMMQYFQVSFDVLFFYDNKLTKVNKVTSA